MKEIDYYKNNEILENSYYQIPQELSVNSLYKEKLNSDSKILYAFLLDRLSLSQRNHWFDEYGRVYLIFTREEVQNKLCLSEKTVTKAFKQLLEVKNTTLDTEILPTINPNNIKTNIINTDSINPKSNEKCIALMDIKEKSKLNEFTKEEQSILEDVIERLYYADNLKVGSIMITNSKILSKQTTIIDKAEKFEKEQENLLSSNMELKNKCRKLELDFSNKEKELKYKYEHETYKVDYQYQKIINKLEKENNYLKKVIDRFKITVQRFISWVCHKFSAPSEDSLVRDFEKETHNNFNIEKQIKYEQNKQKEHELEL